MGESATELAPRPDPPDGLAEAGRKLWIEMHEDLDDSWEFEPREVYLLARACRCADEIALLEAVIDEEGVMAKGSTGQDVVHPALPEVRQLRITQLRLLSTIEAHDPKDGPATPAAKRAARAARTRTQRRRNGGR